MPTETARILQWSFVKKENYAWSVNTEDLGKNRDNSVNHWSFCVLKSVNLASEEEITNSEKS